MMRAVFADLAALVRRPQQALKVIDLDRPLRSGLLALALSLLLPALTSELAGLGPYRPPAELGSLPSLTAQGADIYARWSYQQRFLLPAYGVLIILALWVLAAAAIHGISRALKGHGNFGGFLKLAGYVALIGLLALPFDLLDALARLLGDSGLEMRTGQLTGLISFGIFIWQNLLLIYAARQHYRISTERAVAAVIGPLGAVIVLGITLVIAAAILFALTQSA